MPFIPYNEIQNQGTQPTSGGGGFVPYSPPSVADTINQHNASKDSLALFPSSPSDTPLKAGLKATGNIPSSLFDFSKNIVTAAVHPINTIEGITKATEGAGESLGRTLIEKTKFGDIKAPNGNTLKQNLLQVKPDISEQTYNSLVDSLHSRYGSLDKAQKTATEDPIGFGADILSILEGGANLAGKGAEFENLVSKVGGAPVDVARKVTSKIPDITAPFKSSFNPELKTAFESEGIKPPISAINPSPLIQGAEAVAGKTAFGQKITDIAIEAKDALNNKTEELVNKIKPEKSLSDDALGSLLQKSSTDFQKELSSHVDAIKPTKELSEENLGNVLQQGLREYNQKFKLSEEKIYQEFMGEYGKSQVEGKSTKDILNKIIDQQSTDQFKGVQPQFRNMLNRLTGADNPELKALEEQMNEFKSMKGGKVPPEIEKAYSAKQAELDKKLTFSELKNTRTSVGEELDRNPDNGALKRLYGGLTEDMQQAVRQIGEQSPFDEDVQKALQNFKKLNDSYSTGKAKLESNISQSISQSSPENIVRNLIGHNSADTLSLVKEMVGPERFSEIQKAFLRMTLDDSAKDGVYDVSKIKNTLGKYDKETLDRLLTPDQQKNLNSVVDKLETNKGKSDIATSINKNASPEEIAQKITGRNSADYIKNVKEIVGEDKFKEVSKFFLRDLFEKSNTREKFDITKFEKNINSYDKSSFEEMLPPEEHKILNEAIEKFKKYKTLDDALKASQKTVQGSQTAFLRDTIDKKDRIFSALGAAATGHPGVAAAIILDFGGEFAFSKLFTSDIGRKLLTEGLTGPNLKQLEALKLPVAQNSHIIQLLKYDRKKDE